ncbi:MAG: hypothetical protein EA375_04640 [Acholeplasmataceae bacterium]|nr:MAG: hypothetical protein EA375_04640 [Acholeplasmataceae bacterium]
MRQRKLVIGLLVILALVTSSFTYAYWLDGITQATNTPGTVTIGEAGETTVTLLFDEASEGDLVPDGYTGESTSVLTFDVEWDADVAGTAGGSGTLAVSIISYTLGTLSEEQIDLMFDISITAGNGAAISVGGGVVNVQITVFFENEPATQAIYDQVANGTLSITVSVTVTPNT